MPARGRTCKLHRERPRLAQGSNPCCEAQALTAAPPCHQQLLDTRPFLSHAYAHMITFWATAIRADANRLLVSDLPDEGEHIIYHNILWF